MKRGADLAMLGWNRDRHMHVRTHAQGQKEDGAETGDSETQATGQRGTDLGGWTLALLGTGRTQDPPSKVSPPHL